jgi:hypothetical protein
MSTAGRLGAWPTRPVRCVVVVPLGPADHPTDTVDSVLAYMGSSLLVVVVDDSGHAAVPALLRDIDPRVMVLPAGRHPGGWGGLWVKLAEAYQAVCDNVDFEVLLRLDADALVIGPQPEEDALRAFRADPRLGMLGSHRLDCNGAPRSFQAAAQCLRFESGWRGGYRWSRRAALRKALASAHAHGYENGEHCQGGAYFQSAACVRALAAAGRLQQPALRSSHLGEDQLFALMTKAEGFGIGDLATGDGVLGVRWRGLPCSPEELLERGKKVVHSVRFWEALDEGQIREHFRTRRLAQPPGP